MFTGIEITNNYNDNIQHNLTTTLRLQNGSFIKVIVQNGQNFTVTVKKITKSDPHFPQTIVGILFPYNGKNITVVDSLGIYFPSDYIPVIGYGFNDLTSAKNFVPFTNPPINTSYSIENSLILRKTNLWAVNEEKNTTQAYNWNNGWLEYCKSVDTVRYTEVLREVYTHWKIEAISHTSNQSCSGSSSGSMFGFELGMLLMASIAVIFVRKRKKYF